MGVAGRGPSWMLGIATTVTLPIWSVIDLARGGDHSLLGVEWIFYVGFSVFGLTGAVVARIAREKMRYGLAGSPIKEAPLAELGTQPPVSRYAIASLTCSCLSFMLVPFGFIPGIIFGHVALKQIRNTSTVSGLGIARAGLMVGYGFLVLILLLFICFNMDRLWW